MYVVKQLRQDEFLRLLLSGYTIREAAAYMKISPFTCFGYLREPDFMARLRERNSAIWQEVDRELKNTKVGIVQKAEEAAQEALEEMIKLCKGSSSESIRFKAAQDLLDRDPQVSRTKRIEGSGTAQPSLPPMFLQQVMNVIKEEDGSIRQVTRVEETREAAKGDQLSLFENR